MTQDVVLGRKAAIYVQKAEKLPDQGESGRVGGSLVDQQYRDVIAHGVDAVAGIAFKGFGVGLEDKRLLAGGTDEDFEEVGGDHGGILLRKIIHHRGTETQREGQIRMSLRERFPDRGK
jgi:hypothetical protein